VSVSAFEVLMARYALALAADGLPVERHLVDAPWSAADCPRLALRRGKADQVAAEFPDRVDWVLPVFVHGLVAGANWETTADALHMRANALIQADPVLAAAGVQCVEVAFMARGGDARIGEFVAKYTCGVLTNLLLEPIQ
jgi:hypothetical protein